MKARHWNLLGAFFSGSAALLPPFDWLSGICLCLFIINLAAWLYGFIKD